MALVVRILVVLFAFLAASLVAAFVITLALFMEWQQAMADSNALWLAVGLLGFIISGTGLLPAFLVIALAEGFRLRSVLFYAGAGGAGLVALHYGLGLGQRGEAGGFAVGRELEIMAGAGIAAGFVYWAIAGRNAGAWHEARAANSAQNER